MFQTKDQKVTIPVDILNNVAQELGIVLTLGLADNQQIQIPIGDWLAIINGAFREQNIHVKASSIINPTTKAALKNTRSILENRLNEGTYHIQISTEVSASKDGTLTSTSTDTLTKTLTNTQKFFIVLAIISVLGVLYYFLGHTSQEDKAQDTKAKRTPRSKEVPASS